MRATQDLRIAIRQLLRAPGYTATAVITLALAIGAATVLATAVGAVLLRPMPIAAPEELLVAWGHNPTVTPSSGVEIWVKWERANPTGRSLQVTIGVTAQANL